MKTKDIQELYQIKLHSMDTILHQISLMDQVENEQELSEIIHSLLQAIGNYTGADRVYVFDWETDQKRNNICQKRYQNRKKKII